MNSDELKFGSLGAALSPWLEGAADWIEQFVDAALSVSTLWQAGAVLLAGLLGWALSRPVRARLVKASGNPSTARILARFYRSLAAVIWPVIMVVLVWIATAAFSAAGLPYEGLRIAASLLNAWIIVRLVMSNMKRSVWTTLLAAAAWTIAALYILRLLNPAIDMLDSTALTIGAARVTLLHVLTSLLVAGLALWAGSVAGTVAHSKLRSTHRLNPSMAGLLGQVVKIGFMVVAIIFAMQTVGIDLSALAIFTGALGVGIGFGLQSIFSNFISGIIILFEKSVKVGDFIELQSGVTGLVKEINIRSTLVTTNDNVDILVPNEEFIKSQVINWTLRDFKRRMHISFGVTYDADKDLVKQAGLEAAAEVEWTFDDKGGRQPQVWLVEFGDSSLNFELVVWLKDDAVKRPAKVKADYNWALHSALARHNIEIPFPQRDLHLKPGEPLRVKMQD
jgi:potassium-dependent mechanosensitive channel